VPPLQSGEEKCADLPLPHYSASVALHDNKVYTMACPAQDDDTLDYVYVYDINNNQWDKFSPLGTLQIVDSKVTII